MSKKKWLRIWVKRIVIGFVVLIFLLLFSTRFIPMSLSDKSILKAFQEVKYSPESSFIETKNGKIHYVEIGDTSRPTLLLIHGSPGSWDNWVQLLTKTDLLASFHILAIDRIPYNKTTIRGHFSLEEQSHFLASFIERKCDPCFVAGHSYGGALALQVGLDYEEHIAGVLSIAGTIAMPYQKARWYNYVVKYTPIRWIVSPSLLASNKEMIGLEEDLPILNSRLAEYEGDVVLIQGGQDFLVDPRSEAYIKTQMPKANTTSFFKPNGDHFSIWTDKEVVLEALMRFQ